MINRLPMKVVAVALALFSVCAPEALAKGKAASKWVEHTDCKFTRKRQADGDSFAMEVKTPQGNSTVRTYRLYGVDCPETDVKDALLDARIKEQAAHFDCKPEEIPALGKEAAAFTEKLLRRGKPLVITRGKMGQKAEKNSGRPQRYYALVEVTAPDGKRRMLHELLLEAGLARAHGKPAAWPPEQEDRRGEKEAGRKFMKDLERLERNARLAKEGAWKKAAR